MKQLSRAKLNRLALLMMSVLLLAMSLRVWKLADKNIWLDEGFSVWAARQGPAGIIRWTATDVHPPLYFWILWAWQQFTGEGEFSQRFLSSMLGVLTVAVVYKTAARSGGAAAGGLAALLTAISTFAIAWSQEIRMYSLAACLTCLAMWLAVRLWRAPNWRMWAGYVATAWGLLMTMYITVAALASINLAFVIEYLQKRDKKALWYWASAQVAMGLAFLPWLAYALPRTPAWSIPTPITPGAFVRFYATLLATGAADYVERYWLPTVVVWAILVIGLVWRWRRERWHSGTGLVAILLAWPPALMYVMLLPILGHARPLAPRYLLIVLPAFHIGLAWSIIALRALVSRWSAALAAFTVAAAMLVLPQHYALRHRSDDYLSAAMALKMLARSTDAVILHNDRDWPVFAAHYAGYWHGVPNPIMVDASFADTFLTPIWNDSEAVWLVQTPDALRTDPAGALKSWLSNRALSVVTFRFDQVELGFFARTAGRAAIGPAPAATLRHAVNQSLGPGLQLLGYAQPLTVYQTGETACIFLHWQKPAHLSFDTQVELADVRGQVWRTSRLELPINTNKALGIYQVFIGPDLPEGWYTFHASAGSNRIAVGRLRVEHKTAASAGAQPATSLQVDFAHGIKLKGYDLSSTWAHPGGQLEVRLYWQTSAVVTRRYKVFVHLLGREYNAAQNNFLWGQHDAEPAEGTAPLTTWTPDQTIIDKHPIEIQANAPPGQYQIEIGLYDPITGARVPVVDEQGQAVSDHVILAEVELK